MPPAYLTSLRSKIGGGEAVLLLSILLVAQAAAAARTPTPAPVTLTSTPLPQAGGGSSSSVAGTVKIDRAKADVIFQQDAKAETSPLVSLPEPTVPPSGHRQPTVHRAGEKAFLDFSGKKPWVVDPRTGEARKVELFVGVLGASGYIYAEAAEHQDLPNWIELNVKMLESFEGSPAIWVSDNLKAAVTGPCRYEAEVNRTYEDMATHYGAAVIPARAYKRPSSGSTLTSEGVPNGQRHRNIPKERTR